MQGQAENGTNTPAATESVRPSAALQGWHDLNMAVAKTLPTQLLRAGQLQHATLRALKHHGKVRR